MQKANLNVKMRPGECRCTRKGVKYCYTPRGVRFAGKC